MTEQEKEQMQLRIRELEKEVEKLRAEVKRDSEQKYGLRWIDVPEAFDKESENRIPILTEVKEKAIKNDDGKPTHILIEGDNYHALTCLNYTHKGKIDVIYIDPPYNTGKEFVYKDKRMLETFPDGQTIDSDHPLRHSAWLSFMSKRLELAKNLLSDRGVIFISIDDNEQANLKLLCDQVFGEKNFVGNIIVQTATDNNPTQINTEHEYMFCYALNLSIQNKWFRKSEASELIIEQYKKLKKKFNDDIDAIQKNLREWISKHKKDLPQVSHYNCVDNKGVFTSNTNSSNTKQGDYTYNILHPITKKQCPTPDYGWRWPEETFWKYANEDEVVWGEDETTQPHIKKRIETAVEQLKTVIYHDGRISTQLLEQIFGKKKIFDNPKSVSMLSRIFDFTSKKDSIILDFFAGSGTTFHSIFELNKNDNGYRQCILVQEPSLTCDLKKGEKVGKDGCKGAFKAGFEKVVDITYKRCENVIQGYTNAKGEKVEGLGNSLKYYKTDFVGENSCGNATDADKVELSLKAGCLLALGENTLEEISTTKSYQIFSGNKDNHTAIYFTGNLNDFPYFVEEIEKIQENKSAKIAVYIFCWGSVDIYENEFDNMRGISLKSIPQPILDIYKSINA